MHQGVPGMQVQLRFGLAVRAQGSYQTLRDNADKVPADLKTEVETKVATLRTALEGTDTEAIRRARS